MKMNALLSLALVLAVSLTTGCQLFPGGGDGPDDWTANVMGSYKGTITTGETEFPGTTTLTCSKGILGGTYELDDNGTKVTGTLSGFSKTGERELKCTWTDPAGKGPFTLTFNEDFSAFEGTWTNDADASAGGWNGTK